MWAFQVNTYSCIKKVIHSKLQTLGIYEQAKSTLFLQVIKGYLIYKQILNKVSVNFFWNRFIGSDTECGRANEQRHGYNNHSDFTLPQHFKPQEFISLLKDNVHS